MGAPNAIRSIVVGSFQVGKSTLINVLTRRRRAKTGDGLKACSQKCRQIGSPCKRLVYIHAPGVNAELDHNRGVQEALERVDAAVFIALGTRRLNESELQLGALIASKRLPVILAVNCWPNGWDMTGDPEGLGSPVRRTIEGQFHNVGVKVIGCEHVNVEWAAAARGVLVDRKRAERLILEHGGMCGDAVRVLERRSRIRELERILMPSVAEALDGGVLEYSVLVSKFLNCWR